MADQGPLSPGTVVNDTSAGSDAWSNPGNATASDDSRATAGITFSGSQYLKATNFGFSIPADATINGIIFGIEKKSNGGTGDIEDTEVKAVKGDVIQTTNKAATGVDWPTTEAYTNYGANNDLWGTTWTPAQINASDFGVVIRGIRVSGPAPTIGGNVDHFRATVYYTEAAQPDYRGITIQSQSIRMRPRVVAY